MNANTVIYLGVDNGVSGALAAILPTNGEIMSMIAMPTQKARKGNEIDVKAVSEWLDSLQLTPVCIIEEPGGSKSAKAACSMAGSFHCIRSIFELRGYRWHRVTPSQWQKVMLPGCKPGDTKPRALSAAKALWPAESFLPTDRCRVPHDGMIDAALIAEYGRRARL